ncbi:hypothetical protein GCM10027347_62470 [Larkinella harenae]
MYTRLTIGLISGMNVHIPKPATGVNEDLPLPSIYLFSCI